MLVSAGVLAITEYVRDVEGSRAAAAIEDYLRTEGRPKVYVRPDYPAELSALRDFSGVQTHIETVARRLLPEDFVGLALSSSHAKPVIAR